MGRPDDGRRADWRRTWLTRRAVALHVTVVVVVPAFVALFWWQVQRVRAGNTLSWAYVFEWPFFTGYAVWLWWRLVHEQPGTEPRRRGADGDGKGPPADGSAPTNGAAPGEGAAPSAEDEELAAYNRYLAELAERDAAERERH